jgi:hypothetical protein
MNGKYTMPYDEKDNIDFFIFNITTSGHENSFYVIPKFVMLDRGYLTSSDYEGKKTIYIAPPDYKDSHWTLEFLDKLSFITEEKFNPLLGKSPFEKVCIEKKIDYNKSIDKYRELVISSVKSKLVRFLNSKVTKSSDLYQVSFQRWTSATKTEKKKCESFKESDKIDIFIVQIQELPGNFWIIPKSVLIEKGYVFTKDQHGHATLPIISPSSTDAHWSKSYWNNFSMFN